MHLRAHSCSNRNRVGFTLVELMVAVGLLLVVIAATSRIFSTASKITSLGEANSDVLQETGAIERQVRSDFARIDRDGVFVIQCVAVANNINQITTPSAPLLDPTRPINATIRCDQIAFFVNGTQTSARFSGNQDLGQYSGLSRSMSSRVMYGHGVQVPLMIPEGAAGLSRPDPISLDSIPLVPWTFDSTTDGPNLEYGYWIGGGGGLFNGTQPEARDWTLARQAILMADDGGDKRQFHKELDGVLYPLAPSAQYTYGNNSAISLFELTQAQLLSGVTDATLFPSFDVVNSRVDVAGCNLDDLRRILAPTGSVNWRRRIQNGFFGDPFGGSYRHLWGYVRSEKTAPSMNRQDVMLTTPTLASNCSSFMVDWTWAPGVGAIAAAPFFGYLPSPFMQTQWFGFPDSQIANPDDFRGVNTLTAVAAAGTPTAPINPTSIEGVTGTPIPISYPPGAPAGSIKVYTAVFGFNGDKATFRSFDAPGVPTTLTIRNDYTPWPTAIRITMRLHDPEKRLEQGKTLQLVVELPKRPAS